MPAEIPPSPENGTVTYTQKDILLMAAYDLTKEHADGFPLEHLTVAAFSRSALQFCLSGFPQHPDHNKVKTHVHGKKGLEKGAHILEKVKPGIYRLTERGRNQARALLGEAVEPEAEAEETPADPEEADILTAEEQRVLTLLTSGALAPKINVSAMKWELKDAYRLWGMPDNAMGDEIDDVIFAATSALESAQEKADAAGTLQIGRHILGPGDIRAYIRLSQSLESRFTMHLNLVRMRTRNGQVSKSREEVQHT